MAQPTTRLGGAQLPAPVFAEDLSVGMVLDLGSYHVTEDEVLEFGRRWDPLPIHVDPEAAEASGFGGLIASGIHTMAMTQNLVAQGFVSRLALVAGRGIRSLSLPKPVRPGDTLTGSVEVTAIEMRNTTADLVTEMRMVNQHRNSVLEMSAVTVVRRRL